MRRVRDLAKPAVVGEQGELFPVWRHHPFFTDNPAPTLQAERKHRHHAVVEQVIADSKAGALAHLPSGHFHANAAWLTLWALTYNLLRATGALTSAFHAKATTATLRAHLVHVPARIARSGRRITLHLPNNWPWQHAWTHLFDTAPRPTRLTRTAPAHPACQGPTGTTPWKSWTDQRIPPAHTQPPTRNRPRNPPEDRLQTTSVDRGLDMRTFNP